MRADISAFTRILFSASFFFAILLQFSLVICATDDQNEVYLNKVNQNGNKNPILDLLDAYLAY